MDKKIVKVLNDEHNGFAVTLEVLATLFMFTMFMCTTFYILRVMNVQRYMNTILTSTAAEASRWGGTNTNAYRLNVDTTPALVKAQQELNYLCLDYGATITGGPSTINAIGDPITIQISYHLPPVFQTFGKVTALDGSQTDMYATTNYLGMQITVYSIMSPSKLL